MIVEIAIEPRTERRFPWITASLAAVNVVVWIAMVVRGVSPVSATVSDLVAWGGNFGYGTVAAHQWWRLVTSPFLHVAWWHVAANVAALVAIGRTVEPFVGAKRFAILYAGAMLGGGVASLLIHPTLVCVGASGAVFGIFGAAAVLRLIAREQTAQWPRPARNALRATVLFLALYAFVPGIDNAAHVGGVVIGAALVPLLVPRLSPRHRAAGLGVAAITLLATAIVAARHVERQPVIRAVALRERAAAALAAGKPEPALATIGEALMLSPHDAQSLFVRAEANRLLRKNELADADLTEVLRDHPNTVEAHASRCYVRTALGRCDDAIEDCDAALAGASLAATVRGGVLGHRAYCKSGRQDWAGALGDLAAAESLHPLDAWALEVRGNAEQQLDHFAAAATAFTAAIAVQPRPELWLKLAVVRNLLGHYDEARTAVDEGLALQPRWPLALRVRAEIVHRAGHDEDAVADLDRALALAPTEWEALNNRAWYERRLSRPADALRDIERSIALEPDAPVLYGTRCWVEVDLGRRAAAMRDCRRAIAGAKPDERQVDRGMLRFLEGNPSAAAAEWSAWLRRAGSPPRSELAPYLDQVQRRIAIRR